VLVCVTNARKRKGKIMSNQLTTEEQIELIVKATKLGKRAKVRRNLVYMKTALGATLVPVEVEDEDEVN
jgi:hypothetical protein